MGPDDSVSDIEALLCGPVATGAIDALQPRFPAAWQAQHPGLSSFADRAESGAPLKICVATEEIVGPVRNGGIGTTYAALAEMLAIAGHQVTVLYLRGQEVETETIDHWIDYYAAKGVRFVPVPDYAERDLLRSNADRWLRASYQMMRYLIDHPMDVVHVSEWRGSGYLSLLAKRQGIAFRDTLFIVKTSSPWMWNRLYGAHALDRVDDLVKIAAERQSVELADMVIGGSLHLLRWMESQGYRIPHGRTFVQPNVATFTTLEPLMQRRSLAHGQRMLIDEIVFFGRLESRKGLFIFCQAIRRLIRKGVPLPPRITFMGKPGGRMASHPDQTTPEYIQSVTEYWPTKVSVLTEFQQYEAIEYLLGGARLAVMPSIIENSSMAIYEAAICGIPCVATNVGGNAELIREEDRPHVLCDPHPVSLGDRIEEALRLGGMVPRPSFDNDANLATWHAFHAQLAGGLRDELLAKSRDASPARAPSDARTSVCIYYSGDARALDATLASLAAQDVPPTEILVAVDGESNAALGEAGDLLDAHGHPSQVIDAFDLDAGQAFNLLAQRATGNRLMFLWEGATLKPSAIGTLQSASAASDAPVLTWLHRLHQPAEGSDAAPLRAIILTGASDAFFHKDTRELPLFVDADVFARLGGFTTDYRVLGQDNEFVAKAMLAGIRCETVLVELGGLQARSVEWMRHRGYDLSASAFRSVRQELAAAPLAMRDLLLLARGLSQRSGGGGARKGVDVVKKTESLLTRMIAGLAADPPPVARPEPLPIRANATPDFDLMIEAVDEKPPQKPKTAVAAPASPGFVASSTVSIIDHYAGDLLTPATTGKRSANPTATAVPTQPEPPPPPAYSSALQSLLDRRMAQRDGRIVGQFLGVHQSTLWGWAADLDDARASMTVDLAVGGEHIVLTADRQLPPFATVPPEGKRHGFVIDLPDRRMRHTTPFALTAAGGRLALADATLQPRGQKLRQTGVEGYCDPSDAGLLYGWAWYPDAPERRVDVSIFVEGRFFARLRADRDREDLAQRGTGRGDYGFQIMLPRSLREAGRHTINVVVADIGIPLSRSPLVAEGQRIDVTEPRKFRIFGR